jgi:hypothetical protein
LTALVLCDALLTKARYLPLPGAKTGCVGPDSPGGGSCATACAVHTTEEEEEEEAAVPSCSDGGDGSGSVRWLWLLL